MPTGIYVDHGTGYVLDMTQRFGSFIGFIDTNGGTSGSQVISSLIGKNLFHVTQYNGSAAHTFLNGGVSVIFDKQTGKISWTFLDVENMTIPQEQRYYRIYYGAY